MYARGMTVREIQRHLLELYGLEVSPYLISTVTDAVLETVAEWQNRPLGPMYPMVFFDALRVKIRDKGLVLNKASMSRWRHAGRNQGHPGPLDRDLGRR
jgi:putative transposase